MKPLKLEIPVWAVVLAGLLFVGTIVSVTIYVVKKHEVTALKSKYESESVAKNLIIKEQSDTIKYFKQVIKESDLTTSAKQTQIDGLYAQIRSIKPKVEQYTSSEVFDSIIAYVGPETDSSKFKFSGNQIKHIYTEHLELMEGMSGLIQYQSLVENMQAGINVRNKEFEAQLMLNESTQALLSECDSSTIELGNNLIKERNNKKLWRIGTPSAGVLGLIIGIMLVK